MDPAPAKKKMGLQGPRPAALKIRDDSHNIKKPPPHKPPQRKQTDDELPRQPVIIYSVSPKVIYADESEFRNLVQRLTGPSAEFSTSVGNVSPAARLATVEKVQSPKEWDREDRMELTSAVMADGVEMSQMPGILSPAPGNLVPVADGLFSSVFEPPSLWTNLSPMSNAFSPNFRYEFSGGFTPSPSALLSSAPSNVSPTISYDLFNHFMDP